MALTLLFWNAGQNRRKIWDPTPLLLALIERFDVDVLILAEAGTVPQKVQLSAPDSSLWLQRSTVDDKVVLLERANRVEVQRLGASTSGRMSLFSVEGWNLRLAAVHLADPRNNPQDVRDIEAVDHAKWLRGQSETQENQRLIVLGDFNLAPYDKGLVSAYGFHAVPTAHLARTESRTVGRLARPFLYNPMWSGLGDRSPGLPGSFGGRFLNPNDPGWNAPDQFLISPDLIDHIDWELSGWRTAKGESEASPDHTPARDGGDHYPLLVRIE